MSAIKSKMTYPFAYVLGGSVLGSIITYLLITTFWLDYVESSCLNSTYTSQAANIQKQLKHLSLLQNDEKEQATKDMELELVSSIQTLFLMLNKSSEAKNKTLYESTEKTIVDAIDQLGLYLNNYPLPSVNAEIDGLLSEIKVKGAESFEQSMRSGSIEKE